MASAIHTICRGCGNPITRDWVAIDPSLTEYHAGCRPGAGRIPYTRPQKRYLELPLTVEAFARYEVALGETRIEITRAGHEALVEALGGECPHCNRAMPEGEPHV